ncbi:ECF transporter S component [Microbacterium sp. No. 7]|uniref:ECF transporter S component n=1 Tax=Microbacterium sp. No. 7 TaxID=1714373 RepID=UPI0006D2ACFC|nr:ECF transporter S component [Microbacterium sp. No. 7]
MTTRLLLTCAAIGVAGGLANIGNAYLFNMLVVVAPMLLGVAAGLYFLPGVVALAALRRGGVGLLTSVIAGLVQVPFVPTGIISVSVFVIIGVLMELPFLLGGYRYWRPWLFFVMALWAAAFYSVYWFFAYDLVSSTVVLQIGLPLILAVVLLLTVLIAQLLAAQLAHVGVLRGVQLAEDRRRNGRRSAAGTGATDAAGDAEPRL